MASDISNDLGDTAAWAAPAVHTFSVEDFHRLGSSGVFADSDRVELIEGRIFDMTPIGAPHATSVQKTLTALWKLPFDLLNAHCHIRVRQPLTLARSEPQPDLTIVRGTADDYAARHPAAADVCLVVEVADASLGFDRGLKLAVYAAAGIAEYWIVDVVHRQVEVHREPKIGTEGASYARSSLAGIDDELPVKVKGREIGQVRVRDLLP